MKPMTRALLLACLTLAGGLAGILPGLIEDVRPASIPVRETSSFYARLPNGEERLLETAELGVPAKDAYFHGSDSHPLSRNNKIFVGSEEIFLMDGRFRVLDYRPEQPGLPWRYDRATPFPQVPTNYTALAAVDMDGDSRRELVASNATRIFVYEDFKDSDGASVLLRVFNQRNVTFLAGADVDRDGAQELLAVVREATHSNVCVFDHQSPAGTAPVCRTFQGQTVPVAVGDVDGDGGDEFMVASSASPYHVDLMKFHRSNGTLWPMRIFSDFASDTNAVTPLFANVDLDPQSEVLLLARAGVGTTLTVFEGPAGDFAKLAAIPALNCGSGARISAAAGDFDADSFANVACGSQGHAYVHELPSFENVKDLVTAPKEAATEFDDVVPLANDADPLEIVAADWDRDGVKELGTIVTHAYWGKPMTRFCKYDFQLASPRSCEDSYTEGTLRQRPLVAVGDWDGDGIALIYEKEHWVSDHPSKVIAYLAAPPSIAGVSQDCGYGATMLSVKRASGSETSRAAGYSFSAGISIGFNILEGVFKLAFSTDVTAEFAKTETASEMVTVANTWLTSGFEDAVVYQTIQYHNYKYRVVDSPNPSQIGKDMLISIPLTPTVYKVSLAQFMRDNPDLRVMDGVYRHVIGDARTYPNWGDVRRLTQLEARMSVVKGFLTGNAAAATASTDLLSFDNIAQSEGAVAAILGNGPANTPDSTVDKPPELAAGTIPGLLTKRSADWGTVLATQPTRSGGFKPGLDRSPFAWASNRIGVSQGGTPNSPTYTTTTIDFSREYTAERSTTVETTFGVELGHDKVLTLLGRAGGGITDSVSYAMTIGAGMTVTGTLCDIQDPNAWKLHRFNWGIFTYPVKLAALDQVFQVVHYYVSDYNGPGPQRGDVEAAPELYTEDGAKPQPFASFDWQTLEAVPRYEVQVSDSATFQTLVLGATTSLPLWSGWQTLAPGHYSWRARGLPGGPWSEVHSVFKGDVPVWEMNVTSSNDRRAFSWPEVPGARYYRAQVSRDASFAVILDETTFAALTYDEPLDVPGPAYVRFRPHNAAGAGVWTEAFPLRDTPPANSVSTMAATKQVAPPDFGLVALRPGADAVVATKRNGPMDSVLLGAVTTAVAGSFDKNGLDRLVTLERAANGHDVVVLRTNSSTGFAVSRTLLSGAISDIAAADLDGDGLDEVIVAERNAPYNVTVFDDAERDFAKLTSAQLSMSAIQFGAAVDATGRTAIVLAGRSASDGLAQVILAKLVEMEIRAEKTWDAATLRELAGLVGMTAELASAALGDVDGDGDDDVAIGIVGHDGQDRPLGTAVVLTRQSDDWTKATTLAGCGYARVSLAIADLDGDGAGEIACSGKEELILVHEVLFGSANRSYARLEDVTHDEAGYPKVTAGDVDRDGKLEMLQTMVARREGRPMGIYRILTYNETTGPRELATWSMGIPPTAEFSDAPCCALLLAANVVRPQAAAAVEEKDAAGAGDVALSSAWKWIAGTGVVAAVGVAAALLWRRQSGLK